jgi:hypothetical protein
MTLMSGQTDGPSQPTNRTETAPVAAASGVDEGLSPVLHWLRDAALAVPVVLLALLLAGAAAGRRRSDVRLLATRALTVSAGLALASPAHGLLFDEGVASLTEVARVFTLVLPFVAGTLVAAAVLAAVAPALRRTDRSVLRKQALVVLTALGVLAAPARCRAPRPPAPLHGTVRRHEARR